MQRLGLCCLFKEAPIRFRTTTARYLSTLPEKGLDPLKYLSEIVQSNLKNLLLAVDFCSDEGIGSFRINSGLLPVYTHPVEGYQLDDLPEKQFITLQFQEIKAKASKQNIRLTFHPDQFVVLNSPKEDVVKKSLEDLEYHGLIAKLLGADVINIHGGGGYGDKPEALKRFIKNFDRLSDDVKQRLTVENDDKTFTPQELIPMCETIGIPFVYDVHHHRCLPDIFSVSETSEKALKTWKKEPLFHISSPKEGWKGKNIRSHHDFINLNDVPDEWRNISPLTIDIEAKAKEIAVLKLKDQLIKKNWHFSSNG